MKSSGKENRKGLLQWEVLAFVLLYGILFLSFTDKEKFEWSTGYLLSFSSYIIASLIAIFVLIPTFFEKKKYLQFGLSLFLLLIAMVFVEEFVIEKIFWPETRGDYFSGVFSTVVEFASYVLIPIGLKFLFNFVRAKDEKDELEKLVKESELQLLKSQINPHFFFNSLNNLYSLTLSNSPKSPEIVLRLSNIMRHILEKGSEEFIPLETEVKHLEDFIEVNKLQVEDRSEVTFEVVGEPAGHQIAPNIFSVFIENAFKHSSNLVSDIRIDSKVEIQKDEIHFTISNNFGSRKQMKEIGHGIGLENVRRRLNYIYPKTHQLEITEEEEMFSVSLRIKMS